MRIEGDVVARARRPISPRARPHPRRASSLQCRAGERPCSRTSPSSALTRGYVRPVARSGFPSFPSEDGGCHCVSNHRELCADRETPDVLPGVRGRRCPAHRVRARLARAVDQLAASAAVSRQSRASGRWRRTCGATAARACMRATRTTRWSTASADMLELLDGLGRDRAVWVGHDWGSPVVWSLASHHPERCFGVANLCVPYFAQGFAPAHPGAAGRPRRLSRRASIRSGQWDYQLFYEENFDQRAGGRSRPTSATRSRPCSGREAPAARASPHAPPMCVATAAGSAAPGRRPMCRWTRMC